MPIQKPCVLVTRPKAQGQSLIQRLMECQFDAIDFPLLEIIPLETEEKTSLLPIKPLDDDTVSGHDTVLKYDTVLRYDMVLRYDIVIVVSTNAAHYFLERIKSPDSADLFKKSLFAHWIAVGDATANVLKKGGIDALTPSMAQTSEGLLSLDILMQVKNKSVLILCGKEGRRLIEQTLLARGAQVVSMPLYETRMPAYDASVVEERLTHKQPQLVIITSAKILTHWRLVLNSFSEQLAHLASCPILVVSERIATMASAYGFQKTWIADGAQEEAILKAVNAFFSDKKSEINLN